MVPLAESPELAALGPQPVTLSYDESGQVRLGDCEATPGKVRGKKRNTIVRAKWKQCGDLRKLKVKAKVAYPAAILRRCASRRSA